MKPATNLMKKQAAQLFPDSEAERGLFLASLLNSRPEKRPAVIWTGRPSAKMEFGDGAAGFAVLPRELAPPWLPEEVSFLSPDAAPGKSDLFARGAVYPVDASSIFTASAMLEVRGAKRVLDVCAAPGGKSLFVGAVLKPEFLLSNEVVGKRLGILCHNLRKAGLRNGYTQSLDPAGLAEAGKSCFDLVLVDAPCSGQSLLAKGKENPGCFHPGIIKGNARRQLGILSQSSSCVAPGGYLFYSTCTFARRENEGVIEKFLKREGDFSPVAAPHLDDFRSDLGDFFSYRVYPHRGAGAGGFCCLLKRAGEAEKLSDLPGLFLKYPV